MKQQVFLRRSLCFLLALCLLPFSLPAYAAGTDTVTRLAGDNRFLTAILAAEQRKAEMGVEQFDTIIVASGTNFADALSGSYLSAVRQAPILLTCTAEVDAGLAKTCNDTVVQYIRENLTPEGTVYILGGPKAVEPGLEQVLQDFAVKRLSGSNRYATNLAILEEAGTAGKQVLVCNGEDFADCLSASAAGLPILLVNSQRGLLEAQKAFLMNGSGDLCLIGGTAAVSQAMQTQLSAYGTTARISGGNRFETSVAIAQAFFPSPERVVLAYGLNFPDGLCGGALACAMGAPLILTMDGREAAAAGYVQGKDIRKGTVLGGSALIADQTLENIFGSLTPEEPVPEETVPAETVPEETIPEETVPVETVPVETVPTETVPVETAPEETVPVETVPAETAPEETVPAETVPEETTPEETVPAETVPEETIPAETVPEETIPVETPPVETFPEETAPTETVPEETAPSETIPVETEPPADDSVVDLTDKLNALMRKNAAILKRIEAKYGYYVAGLYYYIRVTDGGDWDIKRTDEWKFEEGKTYVYRGVVMRMDDPGNIHFGYVGAVLFPEEFVCFGAGMNNVSKFGFTAGSVSSYYDDPQDQEMMRWGYRLYGEEN